MAGAAPLRERARAVSVVCSLQRRRPCSGIAQIPLGALFAQLARAAAERDALPIEERIWACWMADANADAESALDRATTDIAARRYDIAETRLVRLVRARADFAEAWHKLGVLYWILERNAEGLQALRQALEREPRHFAALGSLGEILAGEGEREGAALAFHAALRVHPHMGAARERLAAILAAR
jgi:tetratricopeptide (TPR) repeat protein